VLELRRPAQVDVGRAPGRITLILRSASTSQEEPAEVAEVIPLYLSVPDASDTGPPAAAKETAGSETPLGAQDLLHVEVLGVEALERRVRVGSDGTITLPLVGSLTAAGRTPAALGREIARLLADRFVKDPQVSVFVEEYRSRRVAVSGAVGRAGSFEIFRPTTLLEVLALCGGVLPEEAGPRVQIVRPSPDGKSRTFEIDRAALQAGDPQRNLLVAPGDLVHVPFEEMLEVLVQGRVVKPDRYRLRRSSAPTVLRAVLLAGGPAAGSAGRRVEVVRRESATRSRTLEVNLQRIREGKEPDLPLQTDDVIVVR
jgi:polysaccharide export outer membrane protein